MTENGRACDLRNKKPKGEVFQICPQCREQRGSSRAKSDKNMNSKAKTWGIGSSHSKATTSRARRRRSNIPAPKDGQSQDSPTNDHAPSGEPNALPHDPPPPNEMHGLPNEPESPANDQSASMAQNDPQQTQVEPESALTQEDVDDLARDDEALQGVNVMNANGDVVGTAGIGPGLTPR